MTYWRCIKCSYTHHGTVDQTDYRCKCGRWCVDITDIIKNFSARDMTAKDMIVLKEELEQRCIGV